jgi:voltage-gated potassium channel
MRPDPAGRSAWRQRLHEIVFEADTSAGRAFDVGLLVAILASLATVVLESIPSVRADHGAALRVAEWTFTALFTVEYALRLASVDRPARYATSFFGVVDILAILPTYASLFFPGAQSLVAIRTLRLLRVFRILKLARWVADAQLLMTAVRHSLSKITIFVGTVLTIVAIMGSLMYVIEGPAHGFDSVLHGMYWAVVTMTTVGFGDIAPKTGMGRFVASLLMLIGYGVLAVPTGIFSAELLTLVRERPVTTQACPACSSYGHDVDARHCKFCGAGL